MSKEGADPRPVNVGVPADEVAPANAGSDAKYTRLRVTCFHTSITGWGTPQARCDACGATFDWRRRDLVAEAQKLIDQHRAQQQRRGDERG